MQDEASGLGAAPDTANDDAPLGNDAPRTRRKG
jgi:hypothetical protein